MSIEMMANSYGVPHSNDNFAPQNFSENPNVQWTSNASPTAYTAPQHDTQNYRTPFRLPHKLQKDPPQPIGVSAPFNTHAPRYEPMNNPSPSTLSPMPKSTVSPKLEMAQNRIRQLRDLHHGDRSMMIAAFNDIQSIATQFQISMNTPEVVVVGMQSDGKSSFIEALLGFQFNIVDTGIGTRRPLIIQMMYDPEYKTPSCRFQKDELDVQASFTSSHAVGDLFELNETPVHLLGQEMTRRTNLIASRDIVSERPIVLRVRYQKCANLTIYDTPGFRLGGDERLKTRIRDMVMSIIAPKNRIIVCLEQSTVEWANSNSKPIVREVDPYFERTIVVCTKFDNRLKEFLDGASADKYLAGDGSAMDNTPIAMRGAPNMHASKMTLHPNQQAPSTSTNAPFFISMPIQRGLSSESFEEEMTLCQMKDLARLFQLGFNDAKFEKCIGVFALRAHLEQLVYDEYLKQLTPTLQRIDQRVEENCTELKRIARDMNEIDFNTQKSRVWIFIQRLAANIDAIVKGTMDVDVDKHGETLEQELMACNHPAQWGCPPVVVEEQENFDKPLRRSNSIDLDEDGHSREALTFTMNARLTLVGGAQLVRTLDDFETHVKRLRLPPISDDKFACASGMALSIMRQNHVVTHDHVLSPTWCNIVHTSLRNLLHPVITMFTERLHHILQRIFDAAITLTMQNERQFPAPAPPPPMRTTIDGEGRKQRMNSVAPDARRHLDILPLEHHPPFMHACRQIFDTFCKTIIFNFETALHTDLQRLATQPASMTRFDGAENANAARVHITDIAQQKFSHLTSVFAELCIHSFYNSITQPLAQQILPQFVDFFTHLGTSEFEALFDDALPMLKKQEATLLDMQRELESVRGRFVELIEKIKK